MKLLSTILLLTLTLMGPLCAQDLRTKLETVYTNFCDAVKNKDQDKLKNSMSSASYLTYKNELQSAQIKFPDGFYSMAPRMITDLQKQTFIKAIENGPTANSVYFGKDPFGSESMTILKFLKENDQWKFHALQTKISDKMNAKYKAKDSSFLKEADFYPTGILPVTPTEIVPGDYKAMLDIMCEGYKVDVKINGIDNGTFSSTEKAGSLDILILGGVKKGTNTIELTITPIEGKQKQPIRVNIAKILNGQEYEVFAMEETTPPTSIKKDFTVK